MVKSNNESTQERVLLAKALPLSTPFSMIVDVTSHCNLKCNFCFHSIDKNVLKDLNFIPGIMDFELYKELIGQILQFPNKLIRLHLNFRGEPTLHNKLPEMIAYAKEKNAVEMVDFATNGILLSPELNKKLIASGLSDLRVSVEALSAEKYKEISGVKIDFDRFVENIRDFYINKGDCKLTVKILDSSLNAGEEEKFYHIFSGISDNAVIEHVIPKYDHVNYTGMKFELTRDMHGDELQWIQVCPQPFYGLCVLHNGDVSACNTDFRGKITFGNINNKSLVDIWNGEALNNFRVTHLQNNRRLHPCCSKCIYPSYNILKQDILDPYANEILKKFTS